MTLPGPPDQRRNGSTTGAALGGQAAAAPPPVDAPDVVAPPVPEALPGQHSAAVQAPRSHSAQRVIAAARPDATAQTAITPVALATADPLPPLDAPNPGAAPEVLEPRDRPARRPARVRPLSRLRIGRHLAPDGALDRVQVPRPATGLVLGYDQGQLPVMLRIFRPEPTRITLIGGLWISHLIAFRALALGARVVVFTGRPEVWRGFGSWATNRDDRLILVPAEQTAQVTGSAVSPTLLLYDGDLLGASVRPALWPWQTQLTVLRQLTAYGLPAVQQSNVVITQRLDSDETKAAESALRLTSDTAGLLQVMTEDMLATLGGNANAYVWVRPTSIERFQFGNPRR